MRVNQTFMPDADRRDQTVRSALQERQLLDGGFECFWLPEDAAIHIDDLIATDDRGQRKRRDQIMVDPIV